MDNREMMKQMIDLHRASFENSFLTLTTLQKQTEKFVKALISYYPGMTDEGRKLVDQWNDAYKKAINDLKQSIDEGYIKLNELFDSNAIYILQDQTGSIFKNIFNKDNSNPFDLNKTMEEWNAMYKKGFDEFKKNIDSSIKSMENLFPAAEKTRKDTKRK
jgi:hypothetical protein